MHLTDGQLRASMDHNVSEQELTHLRDCEQCQARMTEIKERSEHASRSFSTLNLPVQPSIPSVPLGRARLESYALRKENQSMFKKLFSRNTRPIWVGVGLVAVLAVAMVFPPVRAIANSFLGLFRVEQVTVVEVNPEAIMQGLDSSVDLESIFAEDVQVNGESELQVVANAEEARELSGIAVRLPTEVPGDMKLEVKAPMQMIFDVNTAHVQTILDQLGRTDIQLPAGIDGAVVTVDIPTIVSASYGDCSLPVEIESEKFDPDDPNTYPKWDCVNLIQMASPTISAPPGVDLQQIGQIYLELAGMESDEAARFSQNIDWSTTLVLPLPTGKSEYTEVSVDGVTGTLIRSLGNGYGEYVLLWVRDGIVYALSGNGATSTALAIASSIR